jgi:GNAT superfamily N-acetyltransferase
VSIVPKDFAKPNVPDFSIQSEILDHDVPWSEIYQDEVNGGFHPHIHEAGSLQHWSVEKITKAVTSNLNSLMTYFAQYLDQVDLIRAPGYTIVNSGLQDDTFNYIIDANFSEEQANEKIDQITGYLSRQNVKFSWWISPMDNPPNLQHLLEERGFKTTINNKLMYINLDEWSWHEECPQGLEIVRATDVKTLHDFAKVLTIDESAFKTYFSWLASVLTEDDPIEYYVGYINGKPVVRGLICYFGQVAGLHWLATTQDERNKGYGTAMQAFRLKRAKELGYPIAVLQASDLGYSLYKRMGYKECGLFRELKLVF